MEVVYQGVIKIGVMASGLRTKILYTVRAKSD